MVMAPLPTVERELPARPQQILRALGSLAAEQTVGGGLRLPIKLNSVPTTPLLGAHRSLIYMRPAGCCGVAIHRRISANDQ